MKKIRDLGSLPSDAFEKYQNMSLKQVNFDFCTLFFVFLFGFYKQKLIDTRPPYQGDLRLFRWHQTMPMPGYG